MAEAMNLPKAAARQGTKRRLPPASDASVVFEILDCCVVILSASLLVLMALADRQPSLVHFLYSSAVLGVTVAVAQGSGRRYFLPNFLMWACCSLLLIPYIGAEIPSEYVAGPAAAGAALLLGARLVSGARRFIARRKSQP